MDLTWLPWGPQDNRSYRIAHISGMLLLLLLLWFDHIMFSGFFKDGQNHNMVCDNYTFSHFHISEKHCNHFPQSFDLLFTWFPFEHLFLIFCENTFVVLAFFPCEVLHMKLVWKVLHSKQQIQAEEDTLKFNKERLSRTPAWFLLKSKQSDFLPTRIQFRSYLIKLNDNLKVENLYVKKHQNYHLCFVSCTVTKKQGC